MSTAPIRITGTYTDQYQLKMGQAYFLNGAEHQVTIFDYSLHKRLFERK